ncbi:TAXI family TRAP transporter solute-binding subunit [Collimonas silvisoli]|uniref:TAXI family TRAP transporter solute-binding subunit n=1 Tax=Collimonas silvisoli TaxID=2825884 RepID=UPI001B8CE967|nr:TAXI family TRAP transporter solute-binding subunit [Collimonas silvisoli]
MQKDMLRLARLLLCLGLIFIVLYATFSAVPSRQIRIAAGPEDGSFYAMALQYKKILEKKSYRVDIVSFQNTDEISAEVADSTKHIDIGFVANDLQGKSQANLISLGEIQLQPIFIFINRKVETERSILSLADLRGLSLVLPPEKSVTSQTLLSIFAAYGIDQRNTLISFLPLNIGVTRLAREEFDGGLFILGAESELMAELGKNKKFVLVELAQQSAIVKKFPFLQKVTLPNGIFDLKGKIPGGDVKLLAANISVVAQKKLPPATTYALLEAMREVHRNSNYVSNADEFPKYRGIAIQTNDLVSDFYRNGTPWIFSTFPIAIASILDAYLAPLLGLWFLLSIYRVFIQFEKIRSLTLFFLAHLLIFWTRWHIRNGRPLSTRVRFLLEKIEFAIKREERGLPMLLAEIRHIKQL